MPSLGWNRWLFVVTLVGVFPMLRQIAWLERHGKQHFSSAASVSIAVSQSSVSSNTSSTTTSIDDKDNQQQPVSLFSRIFSNVLSSFSFTSTANKTNETGATTRGIPVTAMATFFQSWHTGGVKEDTWNSELRLGRQRTHFSRRGADMVARINQLAADVLTQPVPSLSPQAMTPPPVTVNCSDPRYSETLTGRKERHQKIIVDIALFGWDADFLEIRLLEYADLIDKFIIPEQNITLKGVPKPWVLPSILEGRLAKWRDKIDYHRQAMPFSYFERVYNRTKKELMEGKGPILQGLQTEWRNTLVDFVHTTYDHHNDSQHIYIIQNDGDEIINRAAMAHFRDCELRSPHQPVFFPSALFKFNTAWLAPTRDLVQWLRLNPSQNHLKELKRYQWALGPYIRRLADTNRDNFRRHAYGFPNMGLGAANHISDPSHTLLLFIKRLSTADAVPPVLPSSFWSTAAAGNLTDMAIWQAMTSCGQYQKRVLISSLEKPLQKFLTDHLPWAVRAFGNERYPWLYREGIVEAEEALHACVCDKTKCNNSKLEFYTQL